MSFFLLLLLLINPKIERTSLFTEKPSLAILVDDTKSIKFLKQSNTVKSVLSKLQDSRPLKEKFEVSFYKFSSELSVLDSLSFSGSQTNIYKTLSETDKLSQSKATLILSDGNQTIGPSYRYFTGRSDIYPVVFGDTAQYEDIEITKVNVNKYSYLNNQFPVEVFTYFKGNQPIKRQISITQGGKIIAKKNILIPANESQRVLFEIQSKNIGNQFYTVKIAPIENEKNRVNNQKDFSVNVLDEQAKILILSDFTHPDVGAFKRSIESNEKRSVVIKRPQDSFVLEDFQAIILYQPTNNFHNILTNILDKGKNMLLVTGKQTDFSFLNSFELGFSKNYIDSEENYTASFNKGFLSFQQEDIGFNSFSPLNDIYGEISINVPHSTLLFQKVNNINTEQPLLTVFNKKQQKQAVLFGEGIWKWRAASFLKYESFKEFDAFVSNIIQYLSSVKNRNRLEVDVSAIHYANNPIVFTTYFFDENYQLDKKANLELEIENTDTKEKTILPFSKQINSYNSIVENLSSGNYRYTVREKRTGKRVRGTFKVLENQIESQFITANKREMEMLAANTSNQLYFPNQIESLIEDLLNNNEYRSIQKSKIKQENLIEWWLILTVIVALLTFEWFARKYYGKI